MKRSDKIMDAGFKVGWCLYFLADSLPKGIPRLIGYLVAIPSIVITVPFAAPFLIVAACVGLWELANDE